MLGTAFRVALTGIQRNVGNQQSWPQWCEDLLANLTCFYSSFLGVFKEVVG